MKTTLDTIIYGTDPEFFLVDRKTARPIPGHKILGNKDAPVKILNSKDEVVGKVFRDGYVGEANTRPHTSPKDLAKDMIRVMYGLEQLLDPSVEVKTIAALPILIGDLADAPDDVKKFGCNPSNNAYTNMLSVPPVDGATHPIRYAGGHLHFSTNIDSKEYNCLTDPNKYPTLVKLMDWLMGLPATYIWGDAQQFMRRINYGRAGEYREQAYENVKIRGYEDTEIAVGVEYRTLPPQIWNNWPLAVMFMNIGKHIIENFDELSDLYPKERENDIEYAINSGHDVVVLTAREVPELDDIYNFKSLSRLRNASTSREFNLPAPMRKNKCCANPNACTQCG